MKAKYIHYRIPDGNFPHDASYIHPIMLSVYNRKWQEFYNPFDRQFKPFPRGGMTECVIYDTVGNRYRGTAYCSLSDNFCYKTGRELAYERAYKCFLENVPY